jgi:hypothetical protein
VLEKIKLTGRNKSADILDNQSKSPISGTRNETQNIIFENGSGS